MTAGQLEAAARRVLSGDADAEERLPPCPAQFFRGWFWELHVCVEASEDGLMFGVYVNLLDIKLFAPGPGQCVRCTATLTACQEAPGAGEPPRHTRILPMIEAQHFVGQGYGWPDFWELGPQAGWDAAAWVAKGLLLEGGSVVRVVATFEAP